MYARDKYKQDSKKRAQNDIFKLNKEFRDWIQSTGTDSVLFNPGSV